MLSSSAARRATASADASPLSPSPIDDVLRSTIGIASPALTGHLGIPDAAAIHHAGLLGRHARSAHAIELTLSSVLGRTIRVEQFVGEWLPITRDERTRLPGAAAQAGSFARLGRDAVVGVRTWSVRTPTARAAETVLAG